jgi:hypothetical protein
MSVSYTYIPPLKTQSLTQCTLVLTNVIGRIPALQIARNHGFSDSTLNTAAVAGKNHRC